MVGVAAFIGIVRAIEDYKIAAEHPVPKKRF
jgi:hypothetical protein